MITPLTFIFQSIPEALVFTAFYLALVGIKIRQNSVKICLSGVLIASTAVVFWALEIPFLLRLLLQMPFIWLIFYFIFTVPFNRVMIAGTVAFGILLSAETISMEVALLVFNLSHNDIIQSEVLRIVVVSGGYIILGYLSWILNKNNWSLFREQDFVEIADKKDIRKINTYLMVLVFQVLLVVFFNLSYVTGLFQESGLFFHIATFAIVTMTGFLLFFAQNLISISAKAGELEVHKEYLKNANELFVTIRGQRHDFLNHIQVIHSYAKMGKNEKVQEYANSLFDEVKEISKITIPNNAILSALLQTKNVILESEKIDLKIDIQTDFRYVKMKDIELVKVVGNLLDNAKEAIIDNKIEKDKRIINLKIFEDAGCTHFVVGNLRPLLSEEQIQTIFVTGYTTKENHTGIGLSIVKQVIEKYKGLIDVCSSEADGTIFKISLPFNDEVMEMSQSNYEGEHEDISKTI